MITYQVAKRRHHPHIGTHAARVTKSRRTSDWQRTDIAEIPNVFLCKKDAERFASLCTRWNMAISHLSNAGEDHLAG